MSGSLNVGDATSLLYEWNNPIAKAGALTILTFYHKDNLMPKPDVTKPFQLIGPLLERMVVYANTLRSHPGSTLICPECARMIADLSDDFRLRAVRCRQRNPASVRGRDRACARLSSTLPGSAQRLYPLRHAVRLGR